MLRRARGESNEPVLRMVGTRSGVTLQLEVRPLGEMVRLGVNLSHHLDDSTLVEHVDALRFMSAVCGTGTVTIRDAAGRVPPLVPLSIYLPSLREIKTASVRTREVDFVSLRTPRTARAPTPPSPPRAAPTGFSQVSGSATSAYGVYRFVVRGPQSESVAALRRAAGDSTADVMVLP